MRKSIDLSGIDLNALAVFAEVAEAGSFTQGAQALGVPKGSVSRKISALEAALGVRLLNRTTRKVSLTDIGRLYYEQCRKGLDELDAAARLIDASRAAPRGTLRISAPADFGGGRFGALIEAFLKTYEQVNIELLLSDDYVDLIEQRIDLAFRSGTLEDSTLIARRLGPTRRILCASPDYLALRGTPETLGELQNHDCIVHGRTADNAHWRFSGPDGAVSVRVNARVAANGMSFLRSLAVRGLGIVLYPEAIARDDIAHGRLSRVLEEYASAESAIYALYPSGRHVSPNVRAFLDMAAEAWSTNEPTSPIAAL